MKNELKELEWDSDFFGFKIAELRIKGNDELFSIDGIESSHYDLVYLFSEEDIKDALEFDAIDVKVTYSKVVSHHGLDENITSYKEPLNDQLLKLVLDAGAFSRFNIDSRLNDKFKNMYQVWMEKSIERVIADEVYVYHEGFGICGFITVRRINEHAEIGLIAVDKEMKNKGIGRKLMNAAENWAANQKLQEIKVATQAANIDACNFYQRLGYEVNSRSYIYHIWKED